MQLCDWSAWHSWGQSQKSPPVSFWLKNKSIQTLVSSFAGINPSGPGKWNKAWKWVEWCSHQYCPFSDFIPPMFHSCLFHSPSPPCCVSCLVRAVKDLLLHCKVHIGLGCKRVFGVSLTLHWLFSQKDARKLQIEKWILFVLFLTSKFLVRICTGVFFSLLQNWVIN